MILRSMALMTGLNVAKALASLAVSIAIAGVVSPGEYGLVGFAIPLTAFITLVTDLGLTSAVVRHPALSREQAGSAMVLMGIAGLLGGGLVAVAARPIENVTSMHGLGHVLLGFAAVTACSVWATVPRALLERTLSYSRIAAVESAALGAALAAFGAGIAASAGIMALVAFHLALQSVRALAFTWLASGRFKPGLNPRSVSPLIRVGGWVFVTNLLSYCARNLDRTLIGAVLGASSLGLYSLGYQFMTIPLMLISWPVSGVLLSTLSRMPGAAEKSRVVCAVVTATASFTLPAMAYLLFGLRYPVEALYAGRWAGLADIVMVLAPVGAIQAIAAYGGAVLVQKGALRLNFALGLLNGLLLSGVFAATVWFGLVTLLLAYAVAATAVSAVMIACMCREAAISPRQFAGCLVPGATAAFVGLAAAGSVAGFNPASGGAWLAATLLYLAGALAAFFVLRARLLQSLHALVGARVIAAAPQ